MKQVKFYQCPLELQIDGLCMSKTRPTVFKSKDIFKKLEQEISPFFKNYLTFFIITKLITKRVALDSLALRKVKRLSFAGGSKQDCLIHYEDILICKYLLRS